MAWLITKDYNPDERAPEGTPLNAAGIAGPEGATDTALDVLRRGGGRAFRIYDDDGNLYYSGRWLPSFDVDDLEVPELQPLTDFGAPNAGATDIKFYEPSVRRWVSI